MTIYNEVRDARLAAIAGTRAILLGDAQGLDALLDTGDIRAMACAQAELIASLLLILPHDEVLAVLDRLTAAALEPIDGEDAA